jgi:hypothetical protein
MQQGMFRRGNKGKVRDVVVCRVLIDVMNIFARPQRPAKMVAHNEPMLVDVTACISVWMLWAPNADVAARVSGPLSTRYPLRLRFIFGHALAPLLASISRTSMAGNLNRLAI